MDEGLIGKHEAHINLLQYPEHYRLDMLTKSLKEKAKILIQTQIEWMGVKNIYTSELESMLSFLMAEDRSYAIPKFKRITAQLDSIRGEDTYATIPELKELLDYE